MEMDTQLIEELVVLAFDEDIKDGDITTNSIISGDMKAVATMSAKADGVVAGLQVAEYVFKKLDSTIDFFANVSDGDFVKKGDVIAKISGSYRTLLTGERTALNFLQRMSGIATETSGYVALTKGYKTQILDTRKTLPGFRYLDKYSVKMGGGTNHRIGLYDMVMIKDNHIKVAGSITKAVETTRKTVSKEIKIEVETTNLKEVQEAIDTNVDIIMLDNMSNDDMRSAVKLIDGRAKVEASGNMNKDRISGVAKTGVDYISIGALTHSVSALDISMNILIKS